MIASLAEKKKQLCTVPGDGHCAYWSFAEVYGLTIGTRVDQSVMRRKLADYILMTRSPPDSAVLLQDLNEGLPKRDQLPSLALHAERVLAETDRGGRWRWASHTDVQSLSAALDWGLRVYHVDACLSRIRYITDDRVGDTVIELLHWPTHYDLLRDLPENAGAVSITLTGDFIRGGTEVGFGFRHNRGVAQALSAASRSSAG